MHNLPECCEEAKARAHKPCQGGPWRPCELTGTVEGGELQVRTPPGQSCLAGSPQILSARDWRAGRTQQRDERQRWILLYRHGPPAPPRAAFDFPAPAGLVNHCRPFRRFPGSWPLFSFSPFAIRAPKPVPHAPSPARPPPQNASKSRQGQSSASGAALWQTCLANAHPVGHTALLGTSWELSSPIQSTACPFSAVPQPTGGWHLLSSRHASVLQG